MVFNITQFEADWSLSNLTLVFQYGSNMDEARINSQSRLRGDAKYFCKAKTVNNYELDFTVWSQNNGCAAADIIPTSENKVWGILYLIPEYLIQRDSAKKRNRKSLDAIEGEGRNYKRIKIEVETETGKTMHPITYEGIDKKKGIQTSWKYAKHIIKGLVEHNLPTYYFEEVKQKIIENNTDLRKYFDKKDFSSEY